MRDFIARLCGILLLSICGFWLNAQDDLPIQRADAYQVSININAYADDQLPVQVIPPIVNEEEAYYIMPKVVPGTYDLSDFGRFVNDFKAFDSSGEELPVERVDNSLWRIKNANELYRFTYRIDDSFDHPVADAEIFRPGGTSFEDSVYLFNLFGMVGYLRGMKNMEFELTIDRPSHLYGATALERRASNANTDLYAAPDYFTLHDRPILYAKADTASTKVNGTRVVAAVYSESGLYSANDALEASSAVLKAIGTYLGGTLPTDKYVVLCFADEPQMGVSGYGALEHQTSTVLYMPEFLAEMMNEEIRHIVAHEFLHIVTPLAIHSEYINDFDFYEPTMSKHLWMYEGVTEYTSVLVQARAGLMDLEEFVAEMESKMETADQFDEHLPMTVMSEHVLDLFNDQFINVYQKGALIGLALDLHMRVNSEGEVGLVDVMDHLSRTFGPDTFFLDDDLFDLIADHWEAMPGMESLELRSFFAKYVEGSYPLPFEELFAEVGILYQATKTAERIGFGDLPLVYDPDNEMLMIYDTENISAMGREMGIEAGDRLVALNGIDINLENARDVFGEFYDTAVEGQKVKLTILRQDEDGDWKKKKLKAKAQAYPVELRHFIQIDDTPTTAQSLLRSAWINH